MVKTIQGPDGTTNEFPDDTPIASIKGVLNDTYGDAAPTIGNLAVTPTGTTLDQVLDAITSVESGGRDVKAKGSSATGPGQIINAYTTNPGFGIAPIKDRSDPDEVRRLQRDILSTAMDQGGTLEDAITAYYRGIPAMKNWIANGRQTDSTYFKKAQPYLQKVVGAMDSTPPAQDAEPPAPTPDVPPAPEGETAAPAGFRETLLRSNPESIAGFLKMAGQLTGIDRLKNAGDWITDEASQVGMDPARIRSIRDIRQGHMVDDAASLAGYYLGAGAASLLPVAVTAGGGAAVGAMVGGPAGAAGGMTTGLLMGSTVLNAGSFYNQLTAEGLDPQKAAEWAGPIGLLGGVLDTATMKSIIGGATQAPEREGLGALAKWIAARSADGASKQTITQGVKQMLFNAGDATATGTSFVDPDKLWSVADAAAGGMVQGGLMEGVLAAGHHAMQGPAVPRPEVTDSQANGQSLLYPDPQTGAAKQDTVVGETMVGDKPMYVMQSGAVVDPASTTRLTEGAQGFMPGPQGFSLQGDTIPGGTGPGTYPPPAVIPQPGLPALLPHAVGSVGSPLDPRLRTPGPQGGILLPSPAAPIPAQSREVPLLPSPTILQPPSGDRTTGPNSGVMVPPPTPPAPVSAGLAGALGVEPMAAKPGAAIMPMPANENSAGVPVTPPLLPPPTSDNRPPPPAPLNVNTPPSKAVDAAPPTPEAQAFAAAHPVLGEPGANPFVYHGTQFRFDHFVPNKEGDIWFSADPNAADAASKAGPSDLMPDPTLLPTGPRTVAASLHPTNMLTVPTWDGRTASLARIKNQAAQANADVIAIRQPSDTFNPGGQPYYIVRDPNAIVAHNTMEPRQGDVRTKLAPSIPDLDTFTDWASNKQLPIAKGDMPAAYAHYQEAFHYATKGLADRDIDAQLASLDRLRQDTNDPVEKLAYVDAYQELTRSTDVANSINTRDPRAWTKMHSALESAVEAVPVTEMTGRQWFDYLSKRPGVSRDELRLMGLEDSLARNPNTFNKTVMGDIVSNAKAAFNRLGPVDTHAAVVQGQKTLVIDSGVPTEDYAARRILAHAARGGFDAISWTPRDQVKDRITSRLLGGITEKWGGQPAGRDAQGNYLFRLPKEFANGVDNTSRVDRQLTPQAREQYESILKGVQQIIAQIAPTAELRLERIGSDSNAVGQQWANIIHVAMGSGNEYSTTLHESVHFLERMGFFRPEEMRVLDAANEKLKALALKEFPESAEDLTRAMKSAPWEARAYGMEAYIKAKSEGRSARFADLPEPLAHVLDKVANLFERIRNWMKGMGFQSANDIFDKVISGEVGHRDIQYTYDTPTVRAVNAISAAATGTSSKSFLDKFGQTHVRDRFGRPAILYGSHTNHPDGGFLYSITGPAGPGFYLSETPQSQQKFTASLVQPTFVSVKKPFDLRQTATAAHKIELQKSLDLVKGYAQADRSAAERVIHGASTLQDIADSGQPIAMNLLGRLARKEGADGIKFTNDGEDHWVTFSPMQHQYPWHLESPSRAANNLTNVLESILKRPQGPYDFAEPHDINLLGHYVYSKRQLAAKEPLFTRIYEVANNMLRYRSTIVQGASHLAAPYGRLVQTDGRAARDVNAALELARLQGMKLEPNSQGEIVVANNTRDTDLSKKGQVIHLDTPQKVKAYQAATAASRYVLNEMKRSMIGDDTTIGGVHISTEATGDEIAAYAKQAQALMQHPDIMKDPAALAHLDTVSKQFDHLAQSVKNVEALIKQDYVPFSRYGDYGAIVEDKDTHNTLHFEMFEGTRTGFGRGYNAAKINARLSDLVRQYPNSQVRRPEGGGPAIFRITHDTIKSLVGQGLGGFDMLAGLLGSADKKTYESIRGVLQEAMRQRNFRAHMTPAEMTPGYSTDFGRSIANYVVGGSGYASRMMHGPSLEENIAAIPRNKVNLIKVAEHYKEYVMSPVEEHSFLKSLGFAWFLGGNISSALVQLSNLPLLSAPHLSQFTNFARANLELLRGFKDTSRMIGKTSAIWAGHLLGNGERPLEPYIGIDMNSPRTLAHLTEDDRQAVLRAWNDGTLKPLLAIQQVGLTPGLDSMVPRSITTLWHKTQSLMSSMFGTMESTGRVAQFLAYYRLARKDPSILERAENVYQKNALYQRQVSSVEDAAEKAYQFASFGIDDVMGNVSKANRAPYQTGEGQLVFQFQGWVHSILETLANMATMNGPAGKKAFALASAWMLTMGGAFGLPAADDLKVIIEGVWRGITKTNLDLKRELREATLGWTDNKNIADFVTRGMDGMLGVATGPRVALGRTPMNDILSGIFGDAEVDDFGGPVGSIIHGNASAFMERRAAGESSWSAAREFLPLFAKNAVEGAFIWNSQGYRTRTNKVITPVVDLKGNQNITPSDRILHAIGFMPSKEATDRDIFETEKLAKDKYETNKEYLEERYSNAVADQMTAFNAHDNQALADARAKVKAAQSDIRDWNDGHKGTTGTMVISETQLRLLTREAMMQRNPNLRYPLEAGRFGRKEVESIRKMYPGQE